MKVLVSGATGFVGKHVVDQLLEKGHEVYGLTRNAEKYQESNPKVNWIQWDDVRHVADLSSAGAIDAVINLVGENIAEKRWNNAQKKVIYNSRIDGTKTMLEMLKKANMKPKIFVSASAIGIYGDQGDQIIHEDAPLTDSFLGKVCKDWEQAAENGSSQYERGVIFRIGIVLGKEGGICSKLTPLFRLGLGGNLADGKFFMPWIHVKDLARVLVRPLEQEDMKGIYNATAPFPVRNSEFTQTYSDVLRKPAKVKVPKFMLKLSAGEFANVMLESAKVVPERLKQENFHFLYPTIEQAVKDVVSKA